MTIKERATAIMKGYGNSPILAEVIDLAMREIIKEEREACAKIAEQTFNYIATKIRERIEQ